MSVMTASSSSNISSSLPGGGSIKKMIRDTSRLLNRPNLPADLRREQERKLAALQVALTDRAQAETEREMTVKYRMVKFFERKKALRHLASAQAKNDSAAIAEAQLDLAYILHFPKDRKYISLYPNGECSEAILIEREIIRKQISEKLALLGAEVLLNKVTKTKNNLKGSEDDEESEEESEEESTEDNDDEEEDDDQSGNEDESNNEEEDSDDGLSYDSDDAEDNEDDTDSDDSDDFDDEFDSDDEDGSDEDENDSEDEDEDSDDDDEDSDDDDEDSEEDSDEEEDDSDDNDEDAPKPKKGRH